MLAVEDPGVPLSGDKILAPKAILPSALLDLFQQGFAQEVWSSLRHSIPRNSEALFIRLAGFKRYRLSADGAHQSKGRDRRHENPKRSALTSGFPEIRVRAYRGSVGGDASSDRGRLQHFSRVRVSSDWPL